MKIGIIGDIHFSEYSSILRRRGIRYSNRLENCVASINWAEEVTAECDQVIYLGDFFDKSSLNAEEITALNHIIWNDSYHRFLVGNHEMGINSLIFSSAHIFNDKRREVIDKPYLAYFDEGIDLVFIPYVLEEDRIPIEVMFPKRPGSDDIKRVIFSHNDISGIQMGKFVSNTGFSIEAIEDNCDLFFNGHIHNGMPVTDKIINVGNLTGQNFSEDGFIYSHNIFILDTETMKYEVIRNPYAINFYKIENIDDLYKVENAVVTIKVAPDEVERAKQIMEEVGVIASRVLIDYSKSIDDIETDTERFTVDHLDEFKKFIYQRLEGNVDSTLLKEEVDYIYG